MNKILPVAHIYNASYKIQLPIRQAISVTTLNPGNNSSGNSSKYSM